jgi:hypothetical protein
MAVSLEDDVRQLDAEGRLRWAAATNHANYYHESSTNGFFDGLAACLDSLADRYTFDRRDDGNPAYFIREAAKQLWALSGDARRWKDPDRLPLASALQHLMSALEIESRRVIEEHTAPNA